MIHPLSFNPASLHVDTPFADVEWPRPELLDARHPLSFTLCIALPQGGGGLNWWELRPTDPVAATRSSLAAAVASMKPHYLEYSVGHMIVHDGFNVHQIAYLDAEPGSARITLQGHAVKYDGVWQLYL